MGGYIASMNCKYFQTKSSDMLNKNTLLQLLFPISELNSFTEYL